MAEKEAESEIPDKVDYHYQKSPQYRTIHVDGAYGGATARGYLAVTFYNERTVIPRKGSRKVEKASDTGELTLGKEEIVETLDGIMRQLEATIILDLNGARELQSWIARHIKTLEKVVATPLAAAEDENA